MAPRKRNTRRLSASEIRGGANEGDQKLKNIAMEVFANARDISRGGVVTLADIKSSLKMHMPDSQAIEVSKHVSKLARFNSEGRPTTRDILTALRLVKEQSTLERRGLSEIAVKKGLPLGITHVMGKFVGSRRRTRKSRR